MGGLVAAVKGAFTTGEPQTAVETDGKGALDLTAAQEAGDVSPAFDKALRAATAAFRETFIQGFGKDESFHNAFFKPDSNNKRRFYALMADYSAGEMMRLAERFNKPR